MMYLLSSLLILAGAFAQYDAINEPPTGLSPACQAAVDEQESDFNTDWISAQVLFKNMYGFMCVNNPLVPDFRGFYSVARCDFGMEFIEAVAPDFDYLVYEIEVLQVIDQPSTGEQQVNVVRVFDAIPSVCTPEDYQIFEDDREATIRGLVEEAMPAPEFSSEVTATFFAYDEGYPANYGSGFQTYVYTDGTFFDETTTLTFMCNECSSPWSVAVEVPPRFPTSDTGILAAAFMNADENFQASECLAKWATLSGNGNYYGEADDNLNIFCRDDAEIMVSMNGATAVQMTSFLASGEGSFELNGARVPFDSSVTTSNDDSAASSMAPTFAAVALTALASVSLRF